MNKLILHDGGFPFDVEALEFIRDSYTATIGALANVAGNKVILEGMAVITQFGTNIVTNGWIVYENEVIPFRSSNVSATIYIFKKIVQVPYNEDEDDNDELDLKDTYEYRAASCRSIPQAGETLVTSFPYAELTRISTLRDLSTPVGMVALWFDVANIPTGWVVCDGTNGTPDMRDTYVKMPAVYDNIGTVSGSHAKNIAIANMPNHGHFVPPHDHAITTHQSDSGNGAGQTQGGTFENPVNVSRTGMSATLQTSTVGGGQAFNVEPKHIDALWIMFKGF